ncbi:MAG: phosphoglucosamine mutase [Oscillospiraceae bacterium]|nr:phosphoglucosamine mutase [Oscillospiraceae bacterium]MDE5885851.1 phosphoglucosamine mutase [Oscillospiraceae bacterium]
MGKYFGTDGFRGEANKTLTADHAYKVGRFLGWYYGECKKQKGDSTPARIVIGKDTRRSSYMFEYSLVSGLTASGADAYLLHVTTTPSVSYVARIDAFDCGIMISASHNPYYDNGIKLINQNGEKMDEETISLVEDYLEGNLEVFGKSYKELPFATGEHIGCTVDYVSGRNRYIGYLISLGLYSFKGIRVGLDCANGASWNLAKAVFDALGATTYVLNASPNGLNINENAGSTHMQGLQKFVVENHLDIGFAYDGDADRCLCVDENGNILTGDHILYIYSKYMKDRDKLRNNTVVTTVMSNFGLYKALDEQGIGYVKTAVGDKYVYEYMSKNDCRLGGEDSGHIIFSKYATTGDGILTSLKIMEVMIARKCRISELAADLKIYPQVLVNVRVHDKSKAQNDPDVQNAVKAAEIALGETGRILVRESGTEPLIRVMVEAPTEEACHEHVNAVVKVIHAKGHAIKNK